jgi:multimeric flavodoxin WrbA
VRERILEGDNSFSWRKNILPERRKAMKVLGVMGSPRVGGNSDILLERALAGAREAGAETEKLLLCQKKISGCLNCERCNLSGICTLQDDMTEIQKKILESNAVIHSVPVYFWSMTAQMKAYLDRWCVFFDREWRLHKAYAPRMQGKRIGLITVCGDPDVATADPIVQSFRNTCEFSGLSWLGAVRVAASLKGEVVDNEEAKKAALELGRKGVVV